MAGLIAEHPRFRNVTEALRFYGPIGFAATTVGELCGPLRDGRKAR
jgi:hypothetical protein